MNASSNSNAPVTQTTIEYYGESYPATWPKIRITPRLAETMARCGIPPSKYSSGSEGPLKLLDEAAALLDSEERLRLLKAAPSLCRRVSGELWKSLLIEEGIIDRKDNPLYPEWKPQEPLQELAQLFWDSRPACEQELPHVARQFDSLFAEKATIRVTVALSLASFFCPTLEKNFYKVRDSEYWRELIGFGPKGEGQLHTEGGRPTLFEYDAAERGREREGYDCDMFRGLTYHHYFTPHYKLRCESDTPGTPIPPAIRNKNFISQIHNNLTKETKGDKRSKPSEDFLDYFSKKLKSRFREWDLTIKLTNAGLAVVSMRRSITQEELKPTTAQNQESQRESVVAAREDPRPYYAVSDAVCADLVQELTANPYEDFREELERESGKDFNQKPLPKEACEKKTEIQSRIADIQQLTGDSFTSYLNAMAIVVTWEFLRDRNIAGEVKEYLEGTDINDGAPYLKEIWEVCNTSDGQEKKTTPLIPPMRNHLISYSFKNLHGERWGDHRKFYLSPHSSDKDPAEWKAVSKQEFLRYFGNNFLALASDAYRLTSSQRLMPSFSPNEIETLTQKDLSKLSHSLCFTQWERVIVSAPSPSPENETYDIVINGQTIAYKTYWHNILRLFEFSLSCKTALQVLSRLLLQCTIDERNPGTSNDPSTIREKLAKVAHLLNRCRRATTPSQISRLPYVREKIEAFNAQIGVPEIVQNVSDDYRDKDAAISTYFEDARTQEESKRSAGVVILTLFLVPLTISYAAHDFAGFVIKDNALSPEIDWLVDRLYSGNPQERVEWVRTWMLRLAIAGIGTFVFFFFAFIPSHVPLWWRELKRGWAVVWSMVRLKLKQSWVAKFWRARTTWSRGQYWVKLPRHATKDRAMGAGSSQETEFYAR